MNILSYNCRGLGNHRVVGRLNKLLRKEGLELVFLMETKRSVVEMVSVNTKLQFPNTYFVDSVGHAGGLGLLWSDIVEVIIMSASVHYIDCSVKGLFGDDEWRFTGFYVS